MFWLPNGEPYVVERINVFLAIKTGLGGRISITMLVKSFWVCGTESEPTTWRYPENRSGDLAPPLSSLAEEIFGSGPEPYGVPPAIAVDPPGINACCRVAGPAREGSGADLKICSSPRRQGGARSPD